MTVLNAVVSEDAFFGAMDVAKFYYGADLPPWDVPSIRIPLDPLIYPSPLLDECGISPFLQRDKAGRPFVFANVRKCIPGLPQSGLLSQLRLVAHLESHGYYETSTPMLFRHKTRPLVFTLVVDDFGVKYHRREDFDHLLSSLQELYSCTSSPVATRYLGLTLAHDRRARSLRVSMPGYIANLLASVCPSAPPRHARSPSIYTPPVFGKRGPQMSSPDDSPPASPADVKRLQQVVGSLLYYGRAVDHSILPAASALSRLQASPSTATIAKMTRLLGYVAAFPDAFQTISASDMLLRVHSDGSHLSSPSSKSVAGGFHYLGTSDPLFVNAPIHCFSSQIPVVTSAVSETEYAAVFANGRFAAEERLTLFNLGYPQPPTLILTDNKCAVGLANRAVTLKMSKSIDMRFHWVRDRVSQSQFLVGHIPGTLNLADFFTKALPVHEHMAIRHLYSSLPT